MRNRPAWGGLSGVAARTDEQPKDFYDLPSP